MLLHKRDVYKSSGRKCIDTHHHQHLYKRMRYKMHQKRQQMRIAIFFNIDNP
jgi:hypothetical protein